MKWILAVMIVISILGFLGGGAAFYVKNLNTTERETLAAETTATINGFVAATSTKEGQGSGWWGIAWRIGLLLVVVPAFGGLLRSLYIKHGRHDDEMENLR